VLAGTVLSGELDAEFSLDLDFAELARARARYLGPDAEDLDVHGKDGFEPPGELRFSLPFLERCTVERLGPGADIEGLRGAYHHRFVSGSGAETRRVLAVGDDDYVTLEQVPKLALAFVILEDARFWEHDGFDREQIERAFWFNLLEARVSRGASTITQQAARSLWLGVDRSITRKLAEAVLAAELERGLDKQRILEVYLNIIELGPEVHGIVEASRYHFGKQPAELELLEALHLASLAPAPVGYSRRFADGRIDREWREHLRTQVRRLRIRHLISRREAEEALRANLQLLPHSSSTPSSRP
jgi:membrane peptidoglycan carboxypeptidase